MSLISYNNESELLPTGFINLGATCYFNALLQSMLSCTSFIDVIINGKESSKNKNKQSKKNLDFKRNVIYVFRRSS